MSPAEITVLVALVLTITQAFKKVLTKLNPVILSAVCSIGVVAYHFVEKGIPFEIIAFLSVVFAVFAGANGGYGIVKRAAGTK